MNKKILRLLIALCFIIGGIVFAIDKEFLYAGICLITGGLYFYYSRGKKNDV